MNKKIDLYHRDELYDKALAKFESGYWNYTGFIHQQKKKYKIKISDYNKKSISEFLRSCRLGSTHIKGKPNRAISKPRCAKYLQHLIRLNNYFKKDWDKITKADTEQFILDLQNNVFFTKQNGNSLTEQTKLSYKISLIKFMKWVYNTDTPPAIVNWFDLRAKDKAMYVPSYKEIDKVLGSNNISIRDKFIIRVLSDSGARLDEFMNSRIKDYERYTAQDGKDYYKLTIHDENSKTFGRTVTLKYSTEVMDQYLGLHPFKQNPDALILPPHDYLHTRNGEDKTLKPRTVCEVVKLNFKRVLNLNPITPKVLRKSSATNYGNYLTHAQMCSRYGWVLSSNQPRRYIERSGISEDEALFRTNNQQIDLVQTNQQLELRALKQELEINRQQNMELKDMMTEFMRRQLLTPNQNL